MVALLESDIALQGIFENAAVKPLSASEREASMSMPPRQAARAFDEQPSGAAEPASDAAARPQRERAKSPFEDVLREYGDHSGE